MRWTLTPSAYIELLPEIPLRLRRALLRLCHSERAKRVELRSSDEHSESESRRKSSTALRMTAGSNISSLRQQTYRVAARQHIDKIPRPSWLSLWVAKRRSLCGSPYGRVSAPDRKPIFTSISDYFGYIFIHLIPFVFRFIQKTSLVLIDKRGFCVIRQYKSLPHSHSMTFRHKHT